MKFIKIKAFAKLNLSLNVLPKISSDGYHQVKFLNCELALADEIKIRKNKKNEIKINCQWQENDCYDSFCPENCLAYQAVKILKTKFPKKIKGVEIFIEKKIPVRAGLGGGSADAAAVLRGMNKFYNLQLSQQRLIKIAKKIGCDVCYSVVGGLAKVERRGEKIIPLKYKLPKYHLVIIVPNIKKISTNWAYRNLDHKKIGKNLEKFKKLISLLQTEDKFKIIDYFHNDFEEMIFRVFPKLKKIRDKLLALGAKKVILAGSGLALVGFFKKTFFKKQILSYFERNFSCIFSKIRS